MNVDMAGSGAAGPVCDVVVPVSVETAVVVAVDTDVRGWSSTSSGGQPAPISSQSLAYSDQSSAGLMRCPQ
jgi:hypothetical protein